MIDKIKKQLIESSKIKKDIANNYSDIILDTARKFSKVLENGNKIMTCGNGGSAADAQHIAAEFVVRLRSKFERRPLPMISLSTDTSCLTACANDFSYDKIFSRQIEALGKSGDLLLGISTSGNSNNVIEAFKMATRMKIETVLLGGKYGGKAKKIAKSSIIVPSKNTMRIQEAHISIGHILTYLTEEILYKN